MDKSLITFLPEFILLTILPLMLLVKKFRCNSTPKTFFTIAKWGVILSLIATVIFYNKSGFPQYYENSLYTTLFKVIIYLLALLWFALACKWFLVEDFSSLGFYATGLCLLVIMSGLISSLNLWIAATSLIAIWCGNYILLHFCPQTDELYATRKNYLFCFLFFAILLIIGCAILQYYCQTSSYGDLYLFFSKKYSGEMPIRIAVALILAALFFSFMLAPFHLWYLDISQNTILPVAGWFTIVPIFAYFSVLLNLIINVFGKIYPEFEWQITIFALLSLLIGAVGVNYENNLKKLFGFACIFNNGFIMLNLVEINANSIFSSFVFLLVYILAIVGVYTAFLGIKSKGIYLENLKDISGLAHAKPYISAALLAFVISLIGSAPMLGFLGRLSVINNLIMEQNYYQVAAILITLVLMANGYLRVVQYIYFAPQNISFDRADKSIYIFLFFMLIAVVISLLHPRILMNDFEKILITVF